MDKRKKIQVLGAVSAASLAGIVLPLVGGTWDNLGNSTWRDTIITWSMLALLVSFTWLTVAYTQYGTPDGAHTPWKRVGRNALIVWGALIAALVLTLSGAPVISGFTGLLQLVLVPSALTLPVWTAVAAIRDRGAHQKGQV